MWMALCTPLPTPNGSHVSSAASWPPALGSTRVQQLLAGKGVKGGRQEAQLPTCPSSGPGSAPQVTTCPVQSLPPHPCPRPIHPACTLCVQQGLGVSRRPALLCTAGSRPGRAWISGASEDPRRLRGEPAACSRFPSKPVPLQRSGEDPPPTHTLCLPWGAPSRRQSHLSNLSRRGRGWGVTHRAQGPRERVAALKGGPRD